MRPGPQKSTLAGSGFGGVDGLLGHGLQVGFSSLGGLLDHFLHGLVGVVGSGHSGLEQCDGRLRTGGCVFGGGVDQVQDRFLSVGQLGFHGLGELGLGAGSDVIHMTAVRAHLLAHGLQGFGLQGQQFLHVFDLQQGLGVGGGLVQSGLASGHVQLGQFFNAGEAFFGQAEQNVEVGFVHGGKLFYGQHENTP